MRQLLTGNSVGPIKLGSPSSGFSSTLLPLWQMPPFLSKLSRDSWSLPRNISTKWYQSYSMTAGEPSSTLGNSLIPFLGFITRNGSNALALSVFRTLLFKTMWQSFCPTSKIKKALSFGTCITKLEIQGIWREAYPCFVKFSDGPVQWIHLNHWHQVTGTEASNLKILITTSFHRVTLSLSTPIVMFNAPPTKLKRWKLSKDPWSAPSTWPDKPAPNLSLICPCSRMRMYGPLIGVLFLAALRLTTPGHQSKETPCLQSGSMTSCTQMAHLSTQRKQNSLKVSQLD